MKCLFIVSILIFAGVSTLAQTSARSTSTQPLVRNASADTSAQTLVRNAPAPTSAPNTVQTWVRNTPAQTLPRSTSAQPMARTTSAQPLAPCSYGGNRVYILKNHLFKIKALGGVSSSTARVADYVEFATMDDIYSYSTMTPPKIMFKKGTSIYGLVIRRKHRHFPVVGGKLELELQPMLNWDGEPIQLAIARHGPVVTPEKESLKDRGRNDPCRTDRKNCVAGRQNASVAPVVPAIGAAGSGVVAARAKDDATRFIAASALFTILSKDSVGDLLSGTDAQISKDEIFDMTVQSPPICELPPQPKEKE